jgi:GMP synthase (glutamine-hydrolysing)
MPRVLVVEHEELCPPEFVGEWLVEEGVELEICRPYRGDRLPSRLSEYDGLVVLGGVMGAYDDADHPWLTHTKALIGQAVADDTPVWGICLGHQLITVALGGQVVVNPAGRASGLTPVVWTDASLHDPLCAGVPRDAVAVQWNKDMAAVLPEHAVVLARGADGAPQVVRFAPRAWGVQFHPEASAEVFGRWVSRTRQRDPSDRRVDGALDAVRAHESELRRSWQPMAASFAAQLALKGAG